MVDTPMTTDMVVTTGTVMKSGSNGDSSEGDDDRHWD
jgi:hypothetical protein